jgi:hypothetical protein
MSWRRIVCSGVRLIQLKHRSVLSPVLAALVVLASTAFTPCAGWAAPWKGKLPPPTLRWAEGQQGCTFSRDSDGKYRYALWTADYGVILAVDSQELQLAHKRVPEPYFSLHLTVRYRGQSTLVVNPRRATLEFVKHFKLIQPALNPESFARTTQADADEVEHQTKREIEKHPERKEEREKYVEEYQKGAAEFLEFLTSRTLRAVQLNPSHAEVKGWILFSAKNKWLGDWKRPEEFVLQLPLGDRILEFPFALPPQQGDLILRQR